MIPNQILFGPTAAVYLKVPGSNPIPTLVLHFEQIDEAEILLKKVVAPIILY